MLNFDNAHVHNTEKVEQTYNEFKFQGLENPPCPSDLSPCDFDLFGYLRKEMTQVSYVTVEELEQAITNTIEGILNLKLIAVLQAWRKRLQQNIENDGNYIE
jgi:hypothetical protein